MIFLFFLSLKAFALPIKPDQSREYLKMRYAIGHIESGNDPKAKNKASSASGKYQFLKIWDGFFQTYAGKRWSDTIPGKSATKAQIRQLAAEQDRLFDRYYQLKVSPFVQRFRAKNHGYSDAELVAIYHRKGERGATRYLRGQSSHPKLKNYLSKYRKALAMGSL